MAKSYVNKLSDVLGAIDHNDKDFFDRLTDEQKKDLSKSLWLMMRYCSSVNKHDMHYLIMTHTYVNVDFAAVSSYPDLLWKMMSLCGYGEKQYHYLLPPVGSVKKDNKYLILSNVFPEYNDDEIDIFIQLNDRKDIIEWCVCYGYEEKDISKYF